MATVGVVTGLAAESACLSGTAAAGDLDVRCAGVRPAAARALADVLAAAGCRGLVSFGLAGGLIDGLAPGTLIIADAVVTPEGTRLAVDPRWRGRVVAALAGLGGVTGGAIAGVDQPIGAPEAKRGFARARGAIACDMESHAVAAAASAAGLPFVVLRAIADGAERPVPAWLAASIGADGRPHLGVILAGLARRPGDLALLLRLAADSRRGLAALRRLVLRTGPRLCFEFGA